MNATGGYSTITVPGGSGLNIFAVAFSSDGGLWMTCRNTNQVARMNVTTPTTQFFTPPAPTSQPTDIITAPDGQIYWLMYADNAIVRMGLSGVMQSPIGLTYWGPNWLVVGTVTVFLLCYCLCAQLLSRAGSDNAFWFIYGAGTNQVGRGPLTVTSSKSADHFQRSRRQSWRYLQHPVDGNLYITENTANKIARLTTAGVWTEFTIPTASSNPQFIVAGPDQALWFSMLNTASIGRMTLSGQFSSFLTPTAGSKPYAMVVGIDGTIWFQDELGTKIGRIGESLL